MTQRELEVLNIIKENPFISQSDIAKKIGSSRSAVSVYLDSLYKGGHILGRGYYINVQTVPLLIGTTVVDIKGILSSTEPVSVDVPKNLVCSEMKTSFGGSTKNIADSLINFGILPHAFFAMGSDIWGDSFLKQCKKNGINTEGTLIVEDHQTPTYFELVDEDLRLIYSSSCAGTGGLANYIKPSHLSNYVNVMKRSSCIAFHDSILPETIEYVCKTVTQPPKIITFSQNSNLAQHVPQLHLFSASVLSYDHAYQLACLGGPDMACGYEDHLSVIAKVAAMGLANFFMPSDNNTIYFCDGRKIYTHTSCNPTLSNSVLIDTYRNCRDLFSAVLIYSMENSMDPIDTLNYMAASRNLLEDTSNYFDRKIDIKLITDEIGNLKQNVTAVEISGAQ